MLGFYDVDKDYISYLKTLDKQIPNVSYDSNNKFVCGVVFNVGDIQYYAPISHMNQKQRTNLPIYHKQRIISTIRFSFMFPAFDDVLIRKDFKQIAQIDERYAHLLMTEYRFCASHINQIKQKAKQVYDIGCNKDHKLNYTCCDFAKLEKYYLDFNKEN